MVSRFLVAALSLSLLVSTSLGERTPLGQTEAQQCRLQRITAAQPSQRITSEGGETELWNERDDQFQCAGVVAMRNVLRPKGLSLPNFHPTPRLVYIEEGSGYISVTSPGCAETYDAYGTQTTRESREKWERGSGRDLHQRVHRVRKGDIVAIHAGAVHWCYNSGNEDLVAVSINDLNHQANQLDQKFRAFYLAGGPSRKGQQGGGRYEEETFHNILREFDTNLLAEAFNIPEEIVRQMQRGGEDRGLSVIAQEKMGFIRPDEREEREREFDNGLEETYCSMKISTNIENPREADIYSRQAGRVNIVDKHKLPVLKFLDMSAERGYLFPNALTSPDWSMQGHTIVYVTRGEAQLQIADHNGQTMMSDRVNKGDMFVVPQYYVSAARAGENGFEWVAFKTTGWPMRNSLAGYTSVIRGLPLQVITNSYHMSPKQAEGLKMNRGGQSFLMSPGRGKQF
ncbi:11S globulin seed storage protein 2-like [Dorcoceras hygrometricum]|uniref:11S globulin seed storage protein 2-like n=1 Tax=Dorcoceras hygrometricum TaxID=472368 RepID=A0A2Z7AJE9_9LAMI|nr:11S globulin seed storage protein 2-like [Dorcoceras hygrometricum]